MLFYSCFLSFIINDYKNTFWTEENEQQPNEVSQSVSQTLTFREKYWLEISDKIYLFTCFLNTTSDSVACLFIELRTLTRDKVDESLEENISALFDYPNLFFRIAFFPVYKDNTYSYNFLITAEGVSMVGSLKVSTKSLEVKLTHKLNSFKNWRSLLKNLKLFTERRFDILTSHKTEYAVYLEYLVIRYVGSFEDKFIRIFLIFIKNFCFIQYKYSELFQICWFSLLEECQPQNDLVTDKLSFVLPNSSYVYFQVLLKANNSLPIFKVEEEVSKPIERKNWFFKLICIGTKTYLALDEETQIPKWRITIPIFVNNNSCKGHTFLIFIVFSKLEQAEISYKEMVLELMINTPAFVKDSSYHNKLKYKLSIGLEKHIVEVELREFGEIVNERTDSWYTLKTEKYSVTQWDTRLFYIDFVNHFNGTIITIENLEEQNFGLRKVRTNEKSKEKLVLFIIIGSTCLVLILIFFLRKANKKTRYKRFRKKN